MALLRIKTAIVHAAHGKVITSMRLETVGINIPFLHTRLSSNQAIFKTQYYSSAALKPPRVLEKQDRRMARVRKLGFDNQVNEKEKETPVEENLTANFFEVSSLQRKNQVQAA